MPSLCFFWPALPLEDNFLIYYILSTDPQEKINNEGENPDKDQRKTKQRLTVQKVLTPLILWLVVQKPRSIR